MKLLLRQNLGFRLCRNIADFFPGIESRSALGLSEVGDRILWDYAKANGFTIVSQDVDFAEMAVLSGSPPKMIWLRAGNQSTAAASTLIR